MVINIIDCSDCKHCYIHPVAWGEFWCKQKEKTSKTKDGYVYDAYSLKKRFREECNDFVKK